MRKPKRAIALKVQSKSRADLDDACIGELDHCPTPVTYVFLAHDKLHFFQRLDPSKSGCCRACSGDRRALYADLFAFGLGLIKIQDDVLGRANGKTMHSEDLINLSPRRIDIAGQG